MLYLKMTPTGIPNKGNTCYKASISQCISRLFNGINIPIERSDTMEDANEFFLSVVNELPKHLKSRMEIRCSVKDKISTHMMLILSPSLEVTNGHIVSCGDVICTNMLPVERDIRDCMKLEILLDKMYTYKLVAGIVSVPGHYYAVVEYNDVWYICNDNQIIRMGTNTVHPVYMLFYLKK